MRRERRPSPWLSLKPLASRETRIPALLTAWGISSQLQRMFWESPPETSFSQGQDLHSLKSLCNPGASGFTLSDDRLKRLQSHPVIFLIKSQQASKLPSNQIRYNLKAQRMVYKVKAKTWMEPVCFFLEPIPHWDVSYVLCSPVGSTCPHLDMSYFFWVPLCLLSLADS